MPPKKNQKNGKPPSVPNKKPASKSTSDTNAKAGSGAIQPSVSGQGPAVKPPKVQKESNYGAASQGLVTDACTSYRASLLVLEEKKERELETWGGVLQRFEFAGATGLAEPINLSLAILSVTEAISRKGTVKFAVYNTTQLDHKSQFPAETFDVHRPDCPIYIPYASLELKTPDEEDKLTLTGFDASKGHLLLATAHLMRNDSVQVKIYDSAPAFLHRFRNKIRAWVKDTLSPQWPGPGRKISQWRFEWVPVAYQASQTACGIHVVLNAWMLAMGLEPSQQLPQRSRTDIERCYDHAIRLISCAAHGFADSGTILAFLRCWGFLADPLIEPPEERRFDNTVRFNEESQMLQELRTSKEKTIERLVADLGVAYTEHVSSGGPGPKQSPHPNDHLDPDKDLGSNGAGEFADSSKSLDSSKSHDSSQSHHSSNSDDPSKPDEPRSEEQSESDSTWTLAFWPPMAEKYPCKFLSMRLKALSKMKGTWDNDSLQFEHPISQKMMWACIASVTEAISLNGYQPQAYLSPQFAGGDLEDRECTAKSFGMTEIEQKKAQKAIKKKRRKQRIGKKLFSFYNDTQLHDAQNGDAVRALRAQEPIFIPLDWRHLIYATARDVEATDPVPEIMHYWMEGLGGAGLPIGQEKRDLEDGSERVLSNMDWWGKKVVFEHTWQPITPVDPNLVLSPNQEREVPTLHLLLAAWTLALGFRPPSTVVFTKEHSSHYKDIKTLFNLASHGLADAATIFAALRCVGWISDAVVPPAPPESVRFDQTALMQDSEIQKDHYNWLSDLLQKTKRAYLNNLAIKAEAARKKHAAKVDAREHLEEEFERKYGEECPDVWPEGLEQNQMAEDLLAARTARAAEAEQQDMVERLRLLQADADVAMHELLHHRASDGGGDERPKAFPESLAALINAEDQRVGYWDGVLRQAELCAAEEKLEEARWAYADALVRNPGVIYRDSAAALDQLDRGDARTSTEQAFGPLEWGGDMEGEKPDRKDEGKKRPWEAYEEENRLVVDVDSEVYGRLRVRADRGGRGLHTEEAVILAKLFKNPPEDPRAGNEKKIMVDVAEWHFRSEAKKRRMALKLPTLQSKANSPSSTRGSPGRSRGSLGRGRGGSLGSGHSPNNAGPSNRGKTKNWYSFSSAGPGPGHYNSSGRGRGSSGRGGW